jgi:UDP-N-acetylglucosamine transferase subunit ALG13
VINEWLSIGIALIAAMGFGSIVSAFVQKHYDYRKLIFEVKLHKYGELIDAYQKSAKDKSESARQNFVSAQKQVELIGALEIVKFSEQFYAGHDKPEDRDKLVKLMRKDLEKI